MDFESKVRAVAAALAVLLMVLLVLRRKGKKTDTPEDDL
jgi:hypothetical protein